MLASPPPTPPPPPHPCRDWEAGTYRNCKLALTQLTGLLQDLLGPQGLVSAALAALAPAHAPPAATCQQALQARRGPAAGRPAAGLTKALAARAAPGCRCQRRWTPARSIPTSGPPRASWAGRPPGGAGVAPCCAAWAITPAAAAHHWAAARGSVARRDRRTARQIAQGAGRCMPAARWHLCTSAALCLPICISLGWPAAFFCQYRPLLVPACSLLLKALFATPADACATSVHTCATPDLAPAGYYARGLFASDAVVGLRCRPAPALAVQQWPPASSPCGAGTRLALWQLPWAARECGGGPRSWPGWLKTNDRLLCRRWAAFPSRWLGCCPVWTGPSGASARGACCLVRRGRGGGGGAPTSFTATTSACLPASRPVAAHQHGPINSGRLRPAPRASVRACRSVGAR
jgi:hypothetical protein